MKVLPGDDIRGIMQWAAVAESGPPRGRSPPFYFGCTTVWATYIGRDRGKSAEPARSDWSGLRPEGHGYEHRGIYRQRSEVERRGSVHEGHTAISAVRVLRPGRPDSRPHRRRL